MPGLTAGGVVSKHGKQCNLGPMCPSCSRGITPPPLDCSAKPPEWPQEGREHTGGINTHPHPQTAPERPPGASKKKVEELITPPPF